MSKIWCKGLGVLLLGPLVAVGSEITLKCEIQDKETKIPLILKLKKGAPAAPIEEEEYGAIPYALEAQASEANEAALSLRGHQEEMSGILDWERLEYEPLELLGLREGNVESATFHYAKEKEEAILFDLVLVSLEKKNSEAAGASSYAGSYGSYKGRNVLCPLEAPTVVSAGH